MKLITILFTFVLMSISMASASSLVQHFGGNEPCRTHQKPVLLVTDTTTDGEIDDSISLLMYREVELRGCIKVIGVVSIFGNGGSNTKTVHENLKERLHALNLDSWSKLVLRGPDRRAFGDMGTLDEKRMLQIANVVNEYKSVVVVELGPMTVSARLLSHDLVPKERIEMVLGVGGRSAGERFKTNQGWWGKWFEFRDMNIAEDTGAANYLVENHPSKLWMVTYQTGVGDREISPEVVGAFAPALTVHAKQRADVLRKVGYRAIPSWDTWTMLYFMKNGAKKIHCEKTSATMRYVEGYRDPMQLHLHVPNGKMIIACHTALTD